MHLYIDLGMEALIHIDQKTIVDKHEKNNHYHR